MNIHDPPAEGKFCNNKGKVIKPQIVVHYNRHMGYIDKGDRMANSYSINRRTWKCTKKLFFHPFDLAILNSYILFSSLGGKKISHSDFRNKLLGNLLAQFGHERNVQRSIGRQPVATTQSLDQKNVAGSTGLFRVPREDVVCVRKRVSPEMFQ